MRLRAKIGKRLLPALGGLLVVLPLAGCGEREPSGQVVAVLDGSEITRRELREELPPALQGALGDQDARLNQALETVIDRKVLAEQARELGLETDPEYHFAMRRAREALLVDALRRKVAGTLEDPKPAEIADYMAAHPWLFARRRQFVLSQAGSGPDVARAIIDTAQFGEMPPDWVASAKADETIEIEGREWQIEAVHPVDLPEKEQLSLARSALMQGSLEEAMDKYLQNARKGAVIRYQPGLGPSGR